METKALKSNLRKALLVYRQKRPHLSLRAIAKISGVNRYFLKKILDEGEHLNQRPLDLNQVVLLTKFINQAHTSQQEVEPQALASPLPELFSPPNSPLVASGTNVEKAPSNYMLCSSQSLNAQAVEELKKIYQHAQEAVEEIMRQPENAGAIPVVALSCLNCLSKPQETTLDEIACS